MKRLQQFIAQAGVASRRKSENLIRLGQVKVNNQIITEIGTKIDPMKDEVEVQGRKITPERKRTFLFYKPLFVITSLSDPQNRRVVTQYIRNISERIYPIGRLDYDTEGLLLLTNDGNLANCLTHPRYGVKKSYIATILGKPSAKELNQLENGITLDDGITAKSKVRLLHVDRTQSKIEIILHEGRNRQIRRMFQAIGYSVQHLIRTKISFLTLKGLKTGDYRELSTQELMKLKHRY